MIVFFLRRVKKFNFRAHHTDLDIFDFRSHSIPFHPLFHSLDPFDLVSPQGIKKSAKSKFETV